MAESAPSSPRGYKYTLFVPPSDSHTEQWEGGSCGTDGAVKVFGADEAFSNTSLAQFLPSLLRSEYVYASLPPSPSPSPSSQPFQPPSPRKRSSLLKLFSPSLDSTASSSTGSSILGSASDPPHLLVAAALAGERAKPLEREMHKLRVIKSPAEIALMQRACDISSAAHAEVMRVTQPGMSEAALTATFEYVCAMAGSERPAYVPVVASGANALVIHYTKNDCVVDENDVSDRGPRLVPRALSDSQLILIDAGCELNMYASDITRTFPASGKFTEPQKDLYQAVLNAQKVVVQACDVSSRVNLQELQRMSKSSRADPR